MSKLIIKKEDFRHNIQRIKEYINPIENSESINKEKPVEIIGVVKGNFYGIGIIEGAKFLIDNGINILAVATVDEAIKLRKAGIKEEILMLSSTAIYEDVETLLENNVTITLGSCEDIETAELVCEKLNKKISAHIKIDTGFGRYGFVYTEKELIVEKLRELKNIKIKGVYSHYSNSYFDNKYTTEQFNRFIDVIEILKLNKIETGLLHICNSSAAFKFRNQHLNAVRLGSAFLGRLSFVNTIGLKKIAHLESKVSEIKELPPKFNIGYSNTFQTKRKTKIAVIPCGYLEGLNIKTGKDMFRKSDKIRYILTEIKAFFKKDKLYARINEQNCEILGRIGTYHIVCDIENKNVQIDSKVELNINPKFVDSSIRREYI